MKTDFHLSLPGTARIGGILPANAMSPFIYALNVGTLAIWLSVTGLGVVGISMPEVIGLHAKTEVRDPFADLESIMLTEDFSVGDTPPSQETDTGTTGEETSEETEIPFAEQETLPTPPEMPDVTETTPLPEIPDVPQPAAKPAETAAPAPTKPRVAPTPNKNKPSRSTMPTSATGGSPQGKVGATDKAGNGGSNGGTGMSDAKRLSGGRMPAPAYPAEARSKGQSGTVLVEFVVGADGKVISAHAKSPSPWPILNERAVSCVLRWKFPPGSVTKYTRPIVFKLN